MTHNKNSALIRYYPSSHTVKINGNSTDIYPSYATYIFERLKIPKNVTIIFNDGIMHKNNVANWLQKGYIKLEQK